MELGGVGRMSMCMCESLPCDWDKPKGKRKGGQTTDGKLETKSPHATVL